MREAVLVLIESSRRHYNAARTHASLGYLTPHEFKATQNLLPHQRAVFSSPRSEDSREVRCSNPRIVLCSLESATRSVGMLLTLRNLSAFDAHVSVRQVCITFLMKLITF